MAFSIAVARAGEVVTIIIDSGGVRERALPSRIPKKREWRSEASGAAFVEKPAPFHQDGFE